MKKEEIIYFLKEKPGYRKKGKETLQSILQNKGYDVSIDDIASAFREFSSSNDETVVESDVIIPEGFEIKSMWQQGNKMMYSFKPKQSEETNTILEDAINELAEYNSKRSFFPILTEGKGIKLHTIADLHIGAYVRDLINTPNYDSAIVTDKLQVAANEINAQGNKENHIALLGDLIESFTGLNHINSWKSMEQGLYGGKVLILAYEIILDFLSRIDNLSGVYIVSGNHDRVTSNNKEDTEGDVAKIIAYFLSQRVNCELIYDTTVISKEVDGINYIIHHGDKSFARGDLADIVLAYGNRDMFNVVLSGHLHTRKGKDRNSLINEDTRKYRAYSCPSIFTGNSYSEESNWTSVSGFYSLSNKFNLPQLIDTPIL